MIDAVPQDPRLVTLPLDAPLIAIGGTAASGKTDALAARAAALIASGAVAPDAALVAATQAPVARELARRIADALASDLRAPFAASRLAGRTLDALAFEIVADGALAGGLAPDLERLLPHECEEIFERAAAPLFSAAWEDFLGADVDPEISGLRTPDRFAAAVLRLINKLRDAGIGPDAFLESARRGAATFYAKPPNLADPALLMATKDEYRASLTVSPAELERQRQREVDLAKSVARLYHAYLEQLVAHGCLGPGDAIAEAVRMLGEQPALARAYRSRIAAAFVDEAHDLRVGELRLLQALFGAKLNAVTIAGAADLATQTFAGARPELVFRLVATELAASGGTVPAQIASVARAVAGESPASIAPGDAVRVHRASDASSEARFVAENVAALIAAGTPPERIAVVHRTARCLSRFDDALVDAGIDVALYGDVDLLARHETGDALAVLWAAADPFRHAWLLRALQLPSVALSDASLAILCGEPPDPQALLFALPTEPAESDRRWDRRRDIRLATNVLRGDRDAGLGETARARVAAFRERRASWAAHARAAGALAAQDLVASAGVLDARPGETPARRQRRVQLVGALVALIERYAARYPGAPLDDALQHLARIAPAERGPIVRADDAPGVFVGAIDLIGPRRFAHVFVVDAKAGSFPPYYVPDAFLFSPTHGMIPKDAVGDGVASRTAKFTWYSHIAKLNPAFMREQRRLLARAMTRADETVTISASGRATRGIGAPEFVTELLAMRL